MPSCKVNGRDVEFDAGMSVIQVCERAGVEIPRFCYHERLSIAGNCRMCLVEVRPGPPKPVASCAHPAAPDMEILTDSPMVRKARNGVMEFLLINHPLDCPICDQGGECDLQDQAMAYGRDEGRYLEPKRAVAEKYMGPLIGTAMTRCIHCTRCVRFLTEVAGVAEIGLLNRGEHAEISTLDKAISSELSGNVIDLCPVGALTSKPYAFTARPWELHKTETVDVMDAMGCAIRVDARGNQVMRVLPRLNEAVNEEWISDKTRFACDGLRRQRLDRPYLRGADGRLQEAGWDEALAAVAARLRGTEGARIAAIAGDQLDVESMYALKGLMRALGAPHLDCRQDGAKLGGGARGEYLFNSTFEGVEAADALLLIGTDPRTEAPVLNARIRRCWLSGGVQIGLLGEARDLTYQYAHCGAAPHDARQLLDPDDPFMQVLREAKRPMLIVGSGAAARADGAAVLAAALRLARQVGALTADWNGFNLLHRAASRVGGLDIGFLPQPGGAAAPDIVDGAARGDISLVYLLGADELDMDRLRSGGAFVVYQGHHGDAGAAAADVVLPGAAYTEKPGIWVNTEGRAQFAPRAVFPPGAAREDWKIPRALSGLIGKPLPYQDFDGLRQALWAEFPHLARDGEAPAIAAADLPSGDDKAKMQSVPFRAPVRNFYMTCPISRASETMAACMRETPRAAARQERAPADA